MAILAVTAATTEVGGVSSHPDTEEECEEYALPMDLTSILALIIGGAITMATRM